MCSPSSISSAPTPYSTAKETLFKVTKFLHIKFIFKQDKSLTHGSKYSKNPTNVYVNIA